MASRSSSSPAQRRARAGMTLLEVMVSLSISLVAMALFSSALVTTSRMGADKRLTAMAALAARNVLETMRSAPHSERYALYNRNPEDDPAGKGTAPGRFFAVDGLTPVPGDKDGFVGEIEIPIFEGLLREDAVDEELGLPRDLDGDTLVDKLDHADDYVILPVRVVIEWQGVSGPRRIVMCSMLTDLTGSVP